MRPRPGLIFADFDGADVEADILVTAPDGRHWQVTRLTRDLLIALAQGEALASIANRLSRQLGRDIEPDVLRAEIAGSLVAKGLVLLSGDECAAPSEERASRLDYMAWRHTLLPERMVTPVARVLSHLISRQQVMLQTTLFVLVIYATMFALVRWRAWSLAAALTPGSVVLMLVGAVVHEFGHAAACQRFGARSGAMGVGVYFLFPVLYMELSDAWRLSRVHRAIVDLAGMTFQLLFGLGLLVVGAFIHGFRATAEATLALITLSAIFNLNPLLRFDGYWLLSDLTGVSNLGRKAQDALRAWVTRRGGPAPSAWTGIPLATRRFILCYAVVVVTFFTWYVGRFAWSLPIYLGVFVPQLAQATVQGVLRGWQEGEYLAVAARLLRAIPHLGACAGLVLMIRGAVRRLARSIAMREHA